MPPFVYRDMNISFVYGIVQGISRNFHFGLAGVGMFVKGPAPPENERNQYQHVYIEQETGGAYPTIGKIFLLGFDDFRVWVLRHIAFGFSGQK
jgi:hypothetical protein